MLEFVRRLKHAGLMIFISAACGIVSAAHAADEIRIEIPAMPALERYVDLLAYPGFLGVVLENNGLSPSMSSKLQVKEHGRALEIRNATLRYSVKKGAIFSYEASVLLNFGVSESKLSFPVTVDLAQVPSGKIIVTAKPPLASLFPAELIDRIRIKAGLVANASAQQKVLDYLDKLAGVKASGPVGVAALAEAILIDAYNRGGGLSAAVGRDVGDAVPLSDQWMLLLTLVIWLLIVPATLFYQRMRARRNEKRSTV